MKIIGYKYHNAKFISTPVALVNIIAVNRLVEYLNGLAPFTKNKLVYFSGSALPLKKKQFGLMKLKKCVV